jgi:hypothetical protein
MNCNMLRHLKHRRSLPATLMILAALVVSITANGYADPVGPNERLSGPAVVGTLTLVQAGTDATVFIVSGKCRGTGPTNGVDVFFTVTVSGLDIATSTAKSLEGLRFPNAGPFGCLFKDTSGGDLIVNTVVPGQFVNTGSVITADVVLLYVVPR